MNKKTAIAALVAVVGVGTFYMKGSQNATLDRPVFDGLDKKKLKKAYNAMFRDAIAQKINIDGKTDDELDQILIQRYHAL